MNELDLVFTIEIEENEMVIKCEATNTETNETETYTRNNKDARKAMNEIINYLYNKGFEIYNVTFTALNIG